MQMEQKRLLSRYSISLGSLGLIVGALISYFGHDYVGDVLMIGGGVLLVGGALVLSTTPTEDRDAG